MMPYTERLLAEMVPAKGDMPVPKPDQSNTVAHLSQTVRNNLGHALRHIDEAHDATNSTSKDFNIHHCRNHVRDAIEHMDKLIGALIAYDSKVGAEIEQLKEATGDRSLCPRA